MAVFRIEKSRDYTVISNYHLRDTELSLKAKGLLTMMLSLPDDWNYTTKGLAAICKEGVGSIGSALKELENAGYMKRRLIRGSDGKIKDTEYFIYERPQKEPDSTEPDADLPSAPKPHIKNPNTVEAGTENSAQLNTNQSNTKELNTDCIKYQSINRADAANADNEERWIDRYEKKVKEIKEQIDYEYLTLNNDKALVDEIVNVMADVMAVYRPKYKIEGDLIDVEAVINNFKKVSANSLEVFLIEYKRIRERIGNKKAYLITALYNLPLTANFALSNMVNHDIFGGGR